MILSLINHPLFILVTFLLVAILSVVLSALRCIRYYQRQREVRLLVLTFNGLCMAVAFGAGALLSAPRPVVDFRYLAPWAKGAWGLFALSMIVSVVMEYWTVKSILGGGKKIMFWKPRSIPLFRPRRTDHRDSDAS